MAWQVCPGLPVFFVGLSESKNIKRSPVGRDPPAEAAVARGSNVHRRVDGSFGQIDDRRATKGADDKLSQDDVQQVLKGARG